MYSLVLILMIASALLGRCVLNLTDTNRKLRLYARGLEAAVLENEKTRAVDLETIDNLRFDRNAANMMLETVLNEIPKDSSRVIKSIAISMKHNQRPVKTVTYKVPTKPEIPPQRVPDDNQETPLVQEVDSLQGS